MNEILKVEGVTKLIGNRTILNNVSFTVNPGETVGFLGPNGAGKTTMIKIILGLLKNDNGTITINGFDNKNEFENAIARVGGIVENPDLYKNHSGLTNLKLFARMYDGITKERIDEVVRLVKLEARIKDKIKKYSLGMRQRLGIAQAILHKPNLLVLDEPTNGLDPVGIKELRDTLRELCDKEGVGILISSHLLGEMDLLCDRVCIIDNGRIIDIKTLEELKAIADITENKYNIETSEPQKAADILLSEYPNVKCEINPKGITIYIAKDEISNISKLLINNDLEVYGINAQQKTLEEAFLEITSGSKNQIQ